MGSKGKRCRSSARKAARNQTIESRLKTLEKKFDALVAGVNICELDPEESGVGYGGLPNAEGVVQLDSCCMHGPAKRAGGVAAIRTQADGFETFRIDVPPTLVIGVLILSVVIGVAASGTTAKSCWRCTTRKPS